MDKNLGDLPKTAFGIEGAEDAEFSEQPGQEDERARTQALADMSIEDRRTEEDVAAIHEVQRMDIERKDAEDARQKQLRPYTDGLPFDLARIRHEIVSRTERMQTEIVEIGLYLIWTREELRTKRDQEDITFQQWVWDNLSFSPRRAYEYMAIADKIVQLGGLESARARTFLRLTGGTKRKALGLLDLTDEEIDKVRQTGTFLGRNLDDVDKMGYRQLQIELREEREKVDAKQGQIDDLQVQLKKARDTIKSYRKGPTQTMHESKTGDSEFTRFLEGMGLYSVYIEKTFDVIEIDPEERHRRDVWMQTLKGMAENIARNLCPWTFHGLSAIEQELSASEGGEKTGEDGT